MVSIEMDSVNEVLMNAYKRGANVAPFTVTKLEDIDMGTALTIVEEFMNAPRIDGFKRVMSHTGNGENVIVKLQHVQSKKRNAKDDNEDA